jgi:hypothetical protein
MAASPELFERVCDVLAEVRRAQLAEIINNLGTLESSPRCSVVRQDPGGVVSAFFGEWDIDNIKEEAFFKECKEHNYKNVVSVLAVDYKICSKWEFVCSNEDLRKVDVY